MTTDWEKTATWLKQRRWVAVVAGGLLWTVWFGAMVLGGTRFESFDVKPQQDSFGVNIQGRIALGDGETDPMGQITSIDHLAFYMPAKFIREGRSVDIYNHDILGPAQNAEFPKGEFSGKLEAYRNPPFFALFHVPTSMLPYRYSVWIWNAISLGCLVLGVLLLRPEKPTGTLLWALTFMPTFTVLTYGQTSLLTFLCFALTYRLLESDHRFAAGLVSSFLWLKPPLLMGLLLWWLWDRRYWRSLAGCIVGGALWLAVTYPIVSAAWQQFFLQLPANIRFDNFQWWKSHNARAFWRLLFTPDSAPLPTLLWVISAMVGIVVFYKLWQRTRASLPLMFGLAIWMMLWASPHTMIYEWSAALIPAILWWTHFPAHRARLFVYMAIMWAALFVSTDFGQIQEKLTELKFGWTTAPLLQVSMIAYVVVSVGFWKWITEMKNASVQSP